MSVADTFLRPLRGFARRFAALALLAILLPVAALAQGGDAVSVDVLALISQALAMGPAGLALGVAAVLVGLVQLVRTFGARLHPALGTPRAAAITSLALAILGALAASLATGAPLTLTVALNAILAGLTASGLFSASKAIARSEAKGAEAAAALQAGGKAAAQAAIAKSPDVP